MDDLIAKWEPELRGLSEPCVKDVFTQECVDAVETLGTLAQGVAADADKLDLPALEAAARRIADETVQWTRDCLHALAQGQDPPDRCVVELYGTVLHGNQELIGEMYAAKRSQ